MTDHDLLMRIDERMGAVLSWQQEHMAKCHKVHDAHNARIGKLEEWTWKAAGALSLLVTLLTLGLRWLWK